MENPVTKIRGKEMLSVGLTSHMRLTTTPAKGAPAAIQKNIRIGLENEIMI